MLEHPTSAWGLGDGGAHCGTTCDASTPTFMLTHWARDRDHDRLPLEWVVRKMTAETASLYGLGDRGVLAPGLHGDLNVIDHDGLRAPAARDGPRPPGRRAPLRPGSRRLRRDREARWPSCATARTRAHAPVNSCGGSSARTSDRRAAGAGRRRSDRRSRGDRPHRGRRRVDGAATRSVKPDRRGSPPRGQRNGGDRASRGLAIAHEIPPLDRPRIVAGVAHARASGRTCVRTARASWSAINLAEDPPCRSDPRVGGPRRRRASVGGPPAATRDRHPWLLDATGDHAGVVDRVVLAVVRDRGSAATGRERRRTPRAGPRARPGEHRVAEHGRVESGSARADGEDQPPARHVVERHCFLGEVDRVAKVR